MAVIPHRIRRLRWRVTAATREEAFDVRARLRTMIETGLLSHIERAFDAVAGEETLYVPRLELKLRVSRLEDIGAALVREIERESAALRSGRTAVAAAPATAPSAEPPPPSAIEALLQYLEIGLLPWTVASLDRAATLALLRAASREEMGFVLARVPIAWPRAIVFLVRWLQLVPESEWTEVARRLEAVAKAPRLGDMARAIESVVQGRGDLASPH